MLSVDLSSLWSDQIDEMIKGIDEAAINITSYLEYRKNNKFTNINFYDLVGDILDVLNCWIEKTYIGDKKNKKLERSFQNFFETFMELLIFFKNCDSPNSEENKFANKCLFRGKVYRYLGYNESRANYKKIEPIYNEIYVSWSKLNKISYIESKLYGWMTLVSCEIKEPYYGIDLEALNISRPHEKEVVFPTIEKLVSDIEYIN